jgi:undecaprenyl-diphosphatase
MLEYWKAIVLGIVQGLTEFLPISSSGHLALGQKLFGAFDKTMLDFFDVSVHVGTLAAIALVFYRQVGEFIVGCFGIVGWAARLGRGGRFVDDARRRLAGLVILATIPTVMIALVFKADLFEEKPTPAPAERTQQDEGLVTGTGPAIGEAPAAEPAKTDLYNVVKDNLPLIAAGLTFTGVWLVVTTRRAGGSRRIAELTWIDMLILGAMQGLAVWPGISRSGSTIGLLLFRGAERETAGRLAFIVAIPAIVGAFMLNTKDLVTSGVLENPDIRASIGPVIVGGVFAFGTGLVALVWLLRVVQSGKLSYFAWYCWALAAICMAIWGINTWG